MKLQVLTSLLIILIFTLIYYETKNQEKVVLQKKNIEIEKKDNELTFDNFLFFKKKASTNDVLTSIKHRKIKNSGILKNKYSNKTGVTWLMVYSLKTITQEFPDVKIIFVNDTIAKFEFYSSVSMGAGKLQPLYNLYNYNNTIRKDNYLFDELFHALIEKYGIPIDAKYDKEFKNVDILEINFSLINACKQLSEDFNIVWKSNKNVKISLTRSYYYYQNEGSDYYASFVVDFEENLYNKATEEHRKLVELDKSRQIEKNKLKRKRDLERI